jgi:hypothetical protein
MHRRFGSAALFALALAAAVTAAACGGVSSPSQNQIQNFSGTVAPGIGNLGSQVHSFNVSKSGEIIVTVTSISPSLPSSTFVGVIFGQPSGSACGVIQLNQFALVGASAVSGPIQPGNYCVQMVDVGTFTTTETYNLKVSHP